MAFGKGIGCSAKVAKIFLFIFTFIFWLTGLAILALGIWAYVDEDSLVENISNILDIAGQAEGLSLKTTAIIFMAVGGFIVLVGFCGCCGAIKEVRCLLGMYIFFLVIIMAAEITGGVLAVVFRDDVTDKIEEVGKKYIRESYNGTSTGVELAWNTVMQRFQCCGMTGPSDFKDSRYDVLHPNMIAPQFCCVAKTSEDFDQTTFEPRNPQACMDGLEACIMNSTNCVERDEFYYHEGCLDAVVDFIKDNYLIFILVGIVIGCLEIFGLIFAICLCTAIGREKK